MSEKKKKKKLFKRSIAKRVARIVLVLLLVSVIMILAGAYYVVYTIASEEYDDYASTVAYFLAEYMEEYSVENNVPIDDAHHGDVLKTLLMFRERFNVDYLYVYEITESRDGVHYVALATKDGSVSEDMSGKTITCDLEPVELDIWDGKLAIANITLDNNYGHEITTLSRFTDIDSNLKIVGVDVSYDDLVQTIISEFLMIAMPTVLILIAFGIGLYLVLRKRVSKPAGKICESMQEYIHDGKRSDVKLPTNGKDEFSMIASSFNHMTDEINQHMEDIQNLTAEQANRQTELDIAARIQKGFLPKEKLDAGNCRIQAVMVPAKDVGGDFYDYIELGDGRYLVAIADVTGKGITAAMFMSVALTLIRQFAKMGLQPHEILRKTNMALAEKNPNMLFVTAFIGIYDSKAQTFTYSNAGHNLPYIVGDELRTLDDATSTVLGIFEDEEYSSAVTDLKPGEFLFLYTDGVTEATATDQSFFGEKALEKTLLEVRTSGGADPLQYIYDKVRAFAGEEEQHDDITMLILTAKKTVSLELGFEMAEFERVKAEILQLPIPRERQLNLCLAAEEVFVNICSYAFPGGAPESEKVRFDLTCSDRVEMRFTDGGMQFNPLDDVQDADDYDPDTQIGGLGTLLYVSLTDGANYEYSDGKNILTLYMNIGEDKENDD